MDLNLKLIEKIKEYNNCYKTSLELNHKIVNKQNVNPDIIEHNAIQSLMVLNDVFELESNIKVRNLHFNYLNFLEKEDYVKCHQIIDELKKIN